jgi:hypothetical protein
MVRMLSCGGFMCMYVHVGVRACIGCRTCMCMHAYPRVYTCIPMCVFDARRMHTNRVHVSYAWSLRTSKSLRMHVGMYVPAYVCLHVCVCV